MVHRSILLVTLVCLVSLARSVPLAAQQDGAESLRPLRLPAEDRPTVALVLSGGGAKGAAHVGVLEVLEELRVPVDMVVGTSMGAIVGGMYAAGYSPAEMRELLVETDWREMFSDRPSPPAQSFRQRQDREQFGYLELGLGRGGIELPSGLITGQRLGFRLKSLLLHTTRTEDFDDLRLPFRAVAADLETADAVVLDDGSLVDAMRASMSVPGVFAPVELDGRILVDGGVVNNFPVNVARDLGAEVIIAARVVSREIRRSDEEDEVPSVLDIPFQVIDAVTQENVEEQRALLRDRDVYIEVDTSPYTAASFADSENIIARGASAADAAREELSRYSVSERSFDTYLGEQRYREEPEIMIDRIEIRSSERVAPQRIRSQMRSEAGEPLDLTVLEQDIERIYALGYFRTVDFDITEDGGESVLIITADDKPWGPNYLRLNLSIQEDFQGGGAYAATGQYAMTQLNRRGGELRVSGQIGRSLGAAVDLYQPIDVQNRFFFEPSLAAQQTVSDVYRDGRREAQYQVRFADGGAYLGVNLGTFLELRAGMGATYGTAGPLIGGEELEDDDFWQVGHRGALIYDSLDSASFPRAGQSATVTWLVNRKALGSDRNTEQLNLDLLGAVSAGRHTVLLQTQGNGTWADESVFPFGPSLGGFLRFSGYRPGELSADYLAQAALIYYYRLFELPAALGEAVYIGASAESGGVWNDLETFSTEDVLFGGSAFLGVDTAIGPLYFAYGFAEGSPAGNFYLILGRPF